jgi:hypothetical protein
MHNSRKSPKATSKKSKESRVWPLGGAPKDMETLDYTKDKDIGESPLPQQAVYLPDPKVREISGFNMTCKLINICIFFCPLSL